MTRKIYYDSNYTRENHIAHKKLMEKLRSMTSAEIIESFYRANPQLREEMNKEVDEKIERVVQIFQDMGWKLEEILEDMIEENPSDPGFDAMMAQRADVPVEEIRQWAKKKSNSTLKVATANDLRNARLEGIREVEDALKDMNWSENQPDNWAKIKKIFESLRS